MREDQLCDRLITGDRPASGADPRPPGTSAGCPAPASAPGHAASSLPSAVVTPASASDGLTSCVGVSAVVSPGSSRSYGCRREPVTRIRVRRPRSLPGSLSWHQLDVKPVAGAARDRPRSHRTPASRLWPVPRSSGGRPGSAVEARSASRCGSSASTGGGLWSLVEDADVTRAPGGRLMVAYGRQGSSR
jgi:hypothetical protein